jgi:hypothetical protein
MTPNQYHRILVSLDQVLFAFHEAADNLTTDDRLVRDELEIIRSQILKAESGHPFPFKKRLTNEEDSDVDMTRAPWMS